MNTTTNTKLYTLEHVIAAAALACTMMFAIAFVSLTGAHVRPILEAESVNAMKLISVSAIGMLISAAVCAAANTLQRLNK